MSKMKDSAIVCNIGHFDNEIQVDKLKAIPGIMHLNIKPQVDKYCFPDGQCIYMLAEGRLVLGPVAATRRYCAGAMDTEDALLRVLQRVSGYRLDAGGLELLQDGEVLARLRLRGHE